MALLKYFPIKSSKNTDKEEETFDKPTHNSPKVHEPKKRGTYLKFTQEKKAEIGKYASENGVAQTVRRGATPTFWDSAKFYAHEI